MELKSKTYTYQYKTPKAAIIKLMAIDDAVSVYNKNNSLNPIESKTQTFIGILGYITIVWEVQECQKRLK